jgi:ribosomal protein L16 Arg81 hydroxylase
MEVFLAGGASLVANEVQTLHSPIDRAAAALGRAFAAQVGANVYCSFKDVQAFGPHYDNHDVFAVQTEGEKIWRIYETQMDTPVDLPPATEETRQWLEQMHGPLLTEVRMRPGDVLYLPRGQFHEALAVDGPSLHVTFSVTALYGRILFSLLDNAAMQFPAFRTYFPPADEAGGRALGAHLSNLATLVRDIVASPAFLAEVAMAQERLVRRPAAFALPERQALTHYRTTGRPFPSSGPALQVAWGWCTDRTRFSIEQMLGEFDFIDEAQLRAAVDAAVASGALERHPQT